MRTTIDKAGRLVLPKEARDRLGLKAGDVLEIETTAEGLHLKPAHEAPRLVKLGKVLVFTGGRLEADAERTIERDRQSRIDDLVRQAIR